jgi:DHA1 family bicyclomycin/chloramphenicol resistance-like MFS transporter
MFAYITGAPFVFITLHGVPEAQFGWFFGANALGYIAASQLNARLLARRSPAAVLRAAVAVGLVAGGLLLACAALEIGGLWGISAGLLVYVSCLGLVMPNATALAFERHGARAGLASAVMGSLQFGIGAAASGVLSALHDGTAVPMAAILAGSGALGWLVLAAHRRLTAGEASPTVEA